MFQKTVVVNPMYEAENLTEKQFKALKSKMFELEYNNFDRNDKDITHHITSFGGKLSDGKYCFAVRINDVRAKELCTTKGGMNDNYIKIRHMMKEMDKVIETLEKIIEDNKDS